MTEVYQEHEDDKGVDVALQALGVLQTCYPSYSWHVREVDGMLIIKELGLSSIFGQYGMAMKNYKTYSWTNLRKEILEAAGEFLERARLPRGKWTGQTPELEGADPRFHRPQ